MQKHISIYSEAEDKCKQLCIYWCIKLLIQKSVYVRNISLQKVYYTFVYFLEKSYNKFTKMFNVLQLFKLTLK